MNFSIFKELDIEIFNEGDDIVPKNNLRYDYAVKRYTGDEDKKVEVDEMREIHSNSEDKSETDGGDDVCADTVIICDDGDKLCSGNIISDIYVNLRPIELTINTTSVDEVIFKKHLVEILNKHS